MDNLRVYGEDDAVSSSGLGWSSTKLPSSSEGLPVTTSSQASVMAASTPATTLVMSGPVPAVSAQTTPASSVHKDCTVALDDLPPPPTPAEPYEAFLARVSRELSSLPVRSAQLGAAVPPRPVVATSTTGSRLPTPFPRYEDSSWALQPQAPGGRIRMPLPASCYAPPPSPWVWPGRGPAVDVTMVRGPLPTKLPTGPPGLSGPSGLPAGPPAVGPAPVPPPSIVLKNTSPPTLRFRGFFPGATPPFIPTASSSSVNIAALPQTPQDAGMLSQGPTPEMVLGWKEEFMEDMRNCWKQFVGDAPPQSTVGPSVSHENMGPDALRQLSPSDDREASWAQHKTGSKRAGSNTRRHSGSREKSSADHTWARVRRPPSSPDSSSPTRRMLPPAKRSRWDRREVSDDSSSSEGQQRSTRPRRPWLSRSPGPRRRNSSHSPSPHRRYRSSLAPSRWSSVAGMTKRLAGRPSPSPQQRSPSHHRQSRRPSRGRQSSPPSRSRGRHHRRSSSSSRSLSPKRHRTDSISPRRHGSRSPSLEHDSHPYDSDIRLLWLRADDDDQHPASTHPRNSPAPGQSTSVDDSLLSAEKVQKLFDDLITPPALSHYADPIPDNASDKQLVPYVRTSTSTASNLGNSEPLETHGLFQNYQSFHRLSGDTEKEACTAAYHDLTNLMLSQTEESPLINVSSSRPKTDEPFRAVLYLPMSWRRNMTSYICNGLPKLPIRRWKIVPWLFISTGLPLKQVLWSNGLLHLSIIHGIKRSSRRSSQRPIKSLPQCPSVGTSTQPPLSCFILHNLPRCRKYRTQRYPRVRPGWKPSQPELPIPLRCPLPL